ncbi:MAG: hypothetical protein JW914_05405, partial [Syntrophaceae bacterium]|nr:hypothetical protein [Syntrophaceae bacterium]
PFHRLSLHCSLFYQEQLYLKMDQFPGVRSSVLRHDLISVAFREMREDMSGGEATLNSFLKALECGAKKDSTIKIEYLSL